MPDKSDTLIMIPARMQANRLPGKPMAMINDAPMIVQVWRRACAAKVGHVVVATDSEEIHKAITDVGGQAQMTRADHQSGSDRIAEALNIVDPHKKAGLIVNLQGDLPTLEPELVTACLTPLKIQNHTLNRPDIATLAARITLEHERHNPNVVKVVGTPLPKSNNTDGLERLRALYFTRATAPSGDGPLYHHIGIYAYTRNALERFIALPPSPLEQRERLEQLRALEAGMHIDVTVVDTIPLGVDTPADLELARQILGDN